MRFEEPVPAVHSTRNSDRMNTVERNVLQPGYAQPVFINSPARAARRIKTGDSAIRFCDQRKAVADCDTFIFGCI